MPFITRLIEIVAEATAPTLTSPAGTGTGTTTATGTVSTDEGNGALFYLASANATESSATVIASGQSQAVSASGVQNVSLTGLTPASVYYLHYVHRDAANNASARVSSSSFSTSTTGTVITRLIAIVSAGDTTAPTLTSPTATATGPTTASGTVSTSEGNGTLYRLASANATETAATVIAAAQSQAVTATGVQNVSFTGLTAETSYYAHYVHRDAANNTSARVTSAQFTTGAASGGGVITRLIAITPRAESISTISGSTAGSTITVTTGGFRNLYTNAPTLTYGGLACTAITVTGASTFTARMPSAGLALGSSNNFVLTVLGAASAPVARTFNPALGQHATFTVPFASFSPDSWARDNELVGVVEALAVPDQIEIALKSSPTTSTPGGYDVHVDGLGNIWLTDPVGDEGNLAAETEGVAVNIALIDASDSHSRSNVMSVNIVQNMPTGTLTLDNPVFTATTATLGFNWTGTNATGFQYRVNGGSWTAIASSPIGLTGLTQQTGYTYDVRAVNGASTGDIVSGSFTTSSSSADTTPDQFTFTPQTGAQISTVTVSNSVSVTGVSAGQDIPVTITGGEYSVSTDSGSTWGAWTSSTSNVRLNYQVRARRTSSATYSTPVSLSVNIGGVSDVFVITTRADDIAPVVTILGGTSITWPVGMTWVDPGATALDNIDGVLTATPSGSPNVNIAGPYVITYSATDTAGNIGTAVRVVTVASSAPGDTTPPTITLNGIAIMSLPQGASWSDPGATAYDSVDGVITDRIAVIGSINTSQIGQQTLTYTVSDTAGNTTSVQRQVYVYAVSTSYTDARDQMRVTRPNNLVYLHTGMEIPTTSAKDPNSRIFKGWELLGFAADEIILAHSILIDGTPVDSGDAVNGLTFHGTQTNGINKVKAEISGGTVGATYRLTLRFTTQYTPSDDRSQDFEVREL